LRTLLNNYQKFSFSPFIGPLALKECITHVEYSNVIYIYRL